MRRGRRPIQDLRTAIDCLPLRTREAMLEGVRSNAIIVGAYTDRDGGVCPMLAAHRCGGRTDFLSFARAWDRFTGARGRARRATEREVRILETHLESSMVREADRAAFDRAIAEHQELASRSASESRAPRPGDPDRSRELRDRRGWAWLRPFRHYDDYRRALARAEEMGAELEADRLSSDREREPA
jgi:hypothetical protein